MKLFKRFFLLKKGIGAAAVAIGLFAFASCENMTTVPTPTMTVTASKTLSTPTFPENTEGNPSYAERYHTVSQGLKRKISLSWNKVEIAKYYEVFAAQNINDTFIKVGETQKAEFEDSLVSGVTCYYKVRAVNTWGDRSEFSAVVRGTTLATPVITEIAESNDDTGSSSKTKLYWYMGNVGIDTYAKDLVYEIHAFKGSEETVVTIKGWDNEKGVVEEYEFSDLLGNTEYMFRIDAYLSKEQNDVESSPKVSKKTLALYTPVSPEFVATQGESVENVKLIITLPPTVQVTVDKTDYDFPVCFEIQRTEAGKADWKQIVPCLYFDGQTTKPSSADAYKNYQEGKTVEYNDSLISSSYPMSSGVKYEYRIMSCIDLNFAEVSKLDFKKTIKSKDTLANTAIGWVANTPTFKVKVLEKNINPSNPMLYESFKFGFEAAWDSMGMGAEYKFAVRQNKRLFASDNGGQVDTYGTNSWLTGDNGDFFTSLDAVNAQTQFLDIGSDASLKGVYRYTLFVVPLKCDAISSVSSDCLVSVEAPNPQSVDTDATKPSRQLAAYGGWSDFVYLRWTVQPGVNYNIEWYKYDAGDINLATPLDSRTIAAADLPKNSDGSYTGEYKHTGLESGFRYKYLLATNNDVAASNDDGTVPVAETLGKPDMTFTANSYSSLTVSWKQSLAAERYKVVLGQTGGFGDGLEFYIDKDGDPVDKDGKAASYPQGVSCAKGSGSFPASLTLAINKPTGFDDASLSGKATDLLVTSISAPSSAVSTTLDLEPAKRQNTGSKKVWTIGPAGVLLDGAQTFVYKPDSIKVSWKKLEGAVGYAIFRERDKIPDGDAGIAADLDIYYVEYDASTQTASLPSDKNPESMNPNDGSTAANINASVAFDSATGVFTLTDTYKGKGKSTKGYDKNQEYMALGVPYNYTVLPVLSSGDKGDFESPEKWELPNADNKTYKANTVKQVKMERYTTGYGLALKGLKAESATEISLSWQKPQSAIKNPSLNATLLCRKKDSAGDWTVVKTGLDKNTYNWSKDGSDGIPSDYQDQALEFAVTYGRNSMSSSGADAAYVKTYLDNIKENAADGGELKSVGYLFSLPKIDYTKDDIFDETFDWHLYRDGNTRAVGGDDVTYTLTVTNLNYSATPYQLYEYTYKEKPANETSDWYDNAANLKMTDKGSNWYAVDKTSAPTGGAIKVSLTPNDITVTQSKDGAHMGILRVLRDYKHEYTITAKSKDGVEATQTVTCCRKITNEEFAKCINLIVADAVTQTSVPGLNSSKELPGQGTGKFYIWHDGAKGMAWGTEGQDYKHIFKSGVPEKTDENFNSAWTLRMSKIEYGGGMDLGADSHRLCHLKTHADGMTVTHESGLASYQGKVDFVVGVEQGGISRTIKWNVTFKKDGAQVCSTDNKKNDFQKWFPYNLGEYFDTSIKSAQKEYVWKRYHIPVFEYSYDGSTFNEWWEPSKGK